MTPEPTPAGTVCCWLNWLNWTWLLVTWTTAGSTCLTIPLKPLEALDEEPEELEDVPEPGAVESETAVRWPGVGIAGFEEPEHAVAAARVTRRAETSESRTGKSTGES